MPNDISHFAIHADDCERAKKFYTAVFGWKFTPWGPPGFWMIETSPGAAVHGALQKRRAPVEGRGVIAFECTISVEEIRTAAAAITKAGGKVLHDPFHIEHVGTLFQFEDTEGNVACAMQYEKR